MFRFQVVALQRQSHRVHFGSYTHAVVFHEDLERLFVERRLATLSQVSLPCIGEVLTDLSVDPVRMNFV